MKNIFVITLLTLLGVAQTPEAALVARARAIHNRVIKLDTHNDIDPRNFTADCNYTMRLTTQVNIPKMIEGGMDVSFMIVYVGQGPLTPAGYDNAYKQAIAKFDAIHRLTENIAPEKIGLALTPEDVVKLHSKGVRIAVIGIENGYPIGTDIKRVKEFYDRGGRYLSLAHNGNSQLADSNTGETEGYLYNNGLSPLGRELIAEANRLGIMIDLSHPSKGANLEAIRLSKAPVIASHSAVRALANVSRNMDDEQLLALKNNGGVIQIVGLSSFIKAEPAEQAPAGGRGGGRGGAPGNATPPPCPVEDPKNPPAAPTAPRANVKDFVNHIDYAVKLIGIDHVGISSDFDGGGGIDGWNSSAEAFNVTLELVRRGYTEEQIGKLWSGNLLRVWGDVEKVAKELQRTK
jgi:membrane dipeptidase